MRLRLLAVLAALALSAPAAAAAADPQPDARAWFVQNGATGEVLLAENDDARVPIASITKLMTVLVALEHAELDDVVTVAPSAAGVEGSTIDLQTGQQITVRDLVEAALIESANDAAWALAAHVGGTVDRFVELMNAKARALGLGDTNFVRPDGLDVQGHVSSARDVTKLARVVMQRPAIRQIVRLRTADAAGRTLHTWNDLLGRFPGLIGVKTGHTSDAGWSQVAAARGRGLTIYAAILGSPTREQRNSDLAELLSWGLAQYRVVEAIDDDRAYATVETPYGRAPVRLVAEKPMLKVVRLGRPLVERVVAAEVVALPVRMGQQLGEVRVFAGDELLGSRPLIAAEAVEKPDFWGRVSWYAGRTLDEAWELVT